MKNISLAQVLLENGYILKKHLDYAMEKEKETGRSFAYILLEENYISEDQLARSLAFIRKEPYVLLEKVTIDPAAVSKLPEDFARKNKVIAFKISDDKLCVAMTDTVDINLLDDIKIKSGGMEISPCLAAGSDIEKAIEVSYS